ncbi:MAG: hypothetical protein OR996_07350, partial [Phycisphaerales bacterium]|nr:hypothetical protein [Phycisphaerales bacterium]
CWSSAVGATHTTSETCCWSSRCGETPAHNARSIEEPVLNVNTEETKPMHTTHTFIVATLAITGAWGPCDGCVEDIDDSGEVNVSDLLTVIAAWGDCE